MQLDSLTVPELRAWLRKSRMARGSAVSVMTRDEIMDFVTNGTPPNRPDHTFKALSTKPQAPVVAPTVATVATVATGHGRDGLPITDHDAHHIGLAAQARWAEAPTSAQELSSRLADVGYMAAPIVAEAAYQTLRMTPVRALMMQGPAGVGKTFLAESLAKSLGAHLIAHTCHQGTRPEDLFTRFVPAEDTVSGLRAVRGKLALAAEASWHGPVVALVDELDKAVPSTDNAFLDLLQSGSFSLGYQTVRFNLTNTIFLIGANAEREVNEFFRRRLAYVKFRYLHPLRIAQLLLKAGIDRGRVQWLVALYMRTVQSVHAFPQKVQKPATIQELVQLARALDGNTDPGAEERLVYVLVTKGDDAHEALKKCDGQVPTSLFEDNLPGGAWQPSRFTASTAVSGITIATDSTNVGIVPRPSRKFALQVDEISTGAVHLSDTAYSMLTSLVPPGDDPSLLGDLFRVTDAGFVTLTRALDYDRDADMIASLSTMHSNGHLTGEVTITVRRALPVGAMNGLRANGLIVTYYTASRIHGHVPIDTRRVQGQVDVQWTPDEVTVVGPMSSAASWAATCTVASAS